LQRRVIMRSSQIHITLHTTHRPTGGLRKTLVTKNIVVRRIF